MCYQRVTCSNRPIQVASVIPGGFVGSPNKIKSSNTRIKGDSKIQGKVCQPHLNKEPPTGTLSPQISPGEPRKNSLSKEMIELFRKTIDPFFVRKENRILVSKTGIINHTNVEDLKVRLSFTVEPRVCIVNDQLEMEHRAILNATVNGVPGVNTSENDTTNDNDVTDTFVSDTVSYETLHSMIIADVVGESNDVSNNSISRIIQAAKPEDVDQLLYQFDHKVKIYTSENIPWCMNRNAVELMVARTQIGCDKQKLEAVDTPCGRIIINLKYMSANVNDPSLRTCIESCDTDRLIENHIMVLWKYHKPPRVINTMYVHSLVRKAILTGMTASNLKQLREIPNGCQMALQYIETLNDTYGWQFNLFYKTQLCQVVEELFNNESILGTPSPTFYT